MQKGSTAHDGAHDPRGRSTDGQHRTQRPHRLVVDEHLGDLDDDPRYVRHIVNGVEAEAEAKLEEHVERVEQLHVERVDAQRVGATLALVALGLWCVCASWCLQQ